MDVGLRWGAPSPVMHQGTLSREGFVQRDIFQPFFYYIFSTNSQVKQEEVAKKEKKEKKEKKDKKRPRTEDADAAPVAKKACSTIADAEKWRKEHAVAMCEEGAKFAPVGFADSGLPKDVLKCTAAFDSPTPIQAQSWPIIMGDRDLIGIAKTGSGKTYAFVLPCLAQIQMRGIKNKPTMPHGLCLAPTRELCTQIAVVGEEAANFCGLRVVRAYGGMPKDEQRREIQKGCNMIIATPGRLKDLCEEGEWSLSLKKVKYAVCIPEWRCRPFSDQN